MAAPVKQEFPGFIRGECQKHGGLKLLVGQREVVGQDALLGEMGLLNLHNCILCNSCIKCNTRVHAGPVLDDVPVPRHPDPQESSRRAGHAPRSGTRGSRSGRRWTRPSLARMRG